MVPMKVLAAAIGQVLGLPLHPTHASISGGAWTPALWFLASEQGAWYDPSDMSTLFQDAAGTTPVTAVEQPVGLVLDKRLGLVRGPEIIPTDATWIKIVATATVTQLAYNSFRVQAPNTGYARCAIPIPFVVGDFYEIDFTVTSASGLGVRLDSLTGVDYLANGRRKNIARASGAAGTSFISFYAHTNTDSTVVIHSFRKLPGNHASQPTAASRTVLSARKNLLLQTESLGTAPWSIGNATITTGQAANAVGQMTLCKVMATATAATIVSQQPSAVGSSAGNTVRFLARKGSGATDCNSFGLYNNSTTTLLSLFTVNYDTGTVTHSYGSGATMTDLGGGLWEVIYTCTTGIATGNSLTIYGGFTGNTETAGEFAYVGEFQLEHGSTATTYQRVTTATDYDTVGFPHYLKFDGVDDFLVTGNIDFTATHEMTVVAGVQSPKTSQGMLLELGSSYDSTFPSFVNFVPNTADGKIFAAYHDAAGYGSYSTAAGVAINANVIAYSFDTAATTVSGKYPRFHLNGVNGMPSDASSIAAGAVFINAPLYIGRRAGTSTPFLGKLYQLVVRGALTADLTPGESFTAEKTGVTLP